MEKDIILGAAELAGQLVDMGCRHCAYDMLFYLRDEISRQIEKLAKKEAGTFEFKGLNQECDVRDALIQSICKGFKARKIRVTTSREDNEYVKLTVDDLGMFWINISLSHIYFKYMWDSVYIHYDRDNYENVARSLFAEDGAFYKLIARQEMLQDNVRHYSHVQDRMNDEKSFQSALADDSEYDRFSAEFSQMYEELKPFEPLCHILTWEEALMEHGISPALKMLSDIDRYTEGKSPESAARYKKRYVNAQNVLSGAMKRGMLPEKEAKRNIPWEEYISPRVSGFSKESLVSEYLASVQKAYESELAACDARGTDYSAKKKKKMLADMEVCRDLKARLGMDCFIDKSSHSRYVYHLNVILNGHNVLVFRIPNKTPETTSLERLVCLAKVLEGISDAAGKNIRLTAYKRTPDFKKLSVEAPKELKSIATGLAAGLKNVKGGMLTISSSYVTLGLPVFGLEWCIALKRKEAAEKLDSIKGLLSEYMKLCNSVTNANVKGVYPERMPNI